MDTPNVAAPQVATSENKVKKIFKNSYKQAGFIIFSIAAIIVVAVIAQKQTHFQNRASSISGTTFLTLLPGSGNVPLQPYTVDLIATLGTEQVDGVQAVFTVSNNSIFSDVSFQPNTISGLKVAANNKTITGTNTQFQLSFVTNVPNQPFSSPTNVSLGKITFVPTIVGSTTVSFDTVLSKIIRHGSVEDILNTPQNVTYQFMSATSAPTPTTTPGGTPTPTGTPSTNGPRITNISTDNKAQTSITITWRTDVSATSQVEYRLTSVSTFLNRTTIDTNLVTNHSVNISGLTPNTKYTYRVISKGSNGVETISQEKSFTTSK